MFRVWLGTIYQVPRSHGRRVFCVSVRSAGVSTVFANADVVTLPQIRLSVTLEDLTLYVAQRADKEKESILRQLSAPIDSVRAKLGGMEGTLAGFQRTMHLVLSEVDADRERAAAIEVSWYRDVCCCATPKKGVITISKSSTLVANFLA